MEEDPMEVLTGLDLKVEEIYHIVQFGSHSNGNGPHGGGGFHNSGFVPKDMADINMENMDKEDMNMVEMHIDKENMIIDIKNHLNLFDIMMIVALFIKKYFIYIL